MTCLSPFLYFYTLLNWILAVQEFSSMLGEKTPLGATSCFTCFFLVFARTAKRPLEQTPWLKACTVLPRSAFGILDQSACFNHTSGHVPGMSHPYHLGYLERKAGHPGQGDAVVRCSVLRTWIRNSCSSSLLSHEFCSPFSEQVSRGKPCRREFLSAGKPLVFSWVAAGQPFTVSCLSGDHTGRKHQIKK